MFTRALMIAGLRKQKTLLEELVNQLEKAEPDEVIKSARYQEETYQIALNLWRLQRMGEAYRLHLSEDSILAN